TLIPGLVQDVFSAFPPNRSDLAVIPSIGIYTINNRLISGSELIAVLTQKQDKVETDPLDPTKVVVVLSYKDALAWVRGFETYIWDQEKPEGLQAKTREGMNRAYEFYEDKGNPIGRLLSGSWEQLTEGTATE